MGLGQGKKRPLRGGETSEPKRGFSRRGSSVVDAASGNTNVCAYASTEQRSTKFSRPPHDAVEVPNWQDDSYPGVDSEAFIIGNIVEGRYSSADERSACNSVSGALRSFTAGDSDLQLCRLQSTGNRFVEFEQHRNWARSLGSRNSKAWVSEDDTLAKSTKGFLVFHHRLIEGSNISHARRIRAEWSKLPSYGNMLGDSTEEEQQGDHSAESHYRIPIWNFKHRSFREGHAIHQGISTSQAEETKTFQRPTFAIFLGKIENDYSASYSADERSRFSVSVDPARVADPLSVDSEVPHLEGVPTLLDESEPVTTRDFSSSELQNERRFSSYVNSSGRHMLKEEAREPTIDNEFEERFSALLLS